MTSPVLRRRPLSGAGILTVLFLSLPPDVHAIVIDDLDIVDDMHDAQAEHGDQQAFYDLVVAGDDEEAFELAFETGDQLFETVFNALDGVGANVGGGMRFSRVPRADLTGPGEWANHFPARATGPNAEACNLCHSQPSDDGSGDASANVHRDPNHAGLGSIISRNTPHLFSPGSLQRLAEEMTERLHAIRALAGNRACHFGIPITKPLVAKGVGFGQIRAIPGGVPCTPTFDTSSVEGVAEDLVVRPFQWKGTEPTVRAFNRGASHNELGMQAVEIVGAGVDGDFDGVVDEMTIGDQTALAVYLAAQPRPTTTLELALLGLIDPPTADEVESIFHGLVVFAQVGCNQCHRAVMKIDDPTFSEPSQNPNYRDPVFPAGQDPVAELVDPDFAVSFDLTQDQPDNVVVGPNGQIVHLGSLKTDNQGRGIVNLFGDLKRHEMGPALAESIDEAGNGASMWLTKELWGVGSTAPYLHDGRATTLTEAILEHGAEAEDSKQSFLAKPLDDQADLIAFLNNLVLFKAEGED
jgi:Di-haem oxidoreductase, putative peroxidase